MIYNRLCSLGLDLRNEQITADKLIFPNYYHPNKKDEYEKYGYDVNYSDRILASLYNDYTFINDGAFEYDRVKLEKGNAVFDCGANVGSFPRSP